ncbi:DeoR/GlpR family DNA-binding transcription regulator [Pectinatus haikarae]|uniref:DeoR family myo-inositol catabolism operon transcriptional repressor n=1 Tax=Pectinatus haikarae TaxID=349096 RepID=A0ABT9YAC4_9FIRM|nr:DeoR/GlpR family DNA-binding transcription regulator [Pectinatus haikarae]MDQ0204147.1 DeoR family myo-inositol catabolism operon transcriptional repressor [Pectinatus haikarae]
MKIDRINRIKEMLQESNTISIDKLCSAFEVSKNTIRRDITELEKQDVIKKIYGGIMLKQNRGEPEPFASREVKNSAEKKIVAKLAAGFVKDNDVIFIDSGTTTMHLIPYLANIKNLTILTTSLYIINAAANYSQFNIICTGGTFYYPSKAFIGSSVLKCLDNYNISKVFLASAGVSLENGVTNTSSLECETKKFLMSKNTPKILLIDSSKLDTASLMTFAQLKDFDDVVIDNKPPQKYITYFADNNVNLWYSKNRD